MTRRKRSKEGNQGSVAMGVGLGGLDPSYELLRQRRQAGRLRYGVATRAQLAGFLPSADGWLTGYTRHLDGGGQEVEACTAFDGSPSQRTSIYLQKPGESAT